MLSRSLCPFFLTLVACAHLAALPEDPNLQLDATYGLRPRDAGHSYYASPDDWRDVNIYQLFTDRFADGDPSNNTTGAMGINRSAWFESGKAFPSNRNYHHGGDWQGITKNLDYLTGMGVNAIWISGVQMNAQGKDSRYTPYHMYHPTDFFHVDPVMGTFQDLKELIDAAHARGVYVILDVVINHTADLNGLWGNNQSDDTRYFGSGNGSLGWWDNNRKHAYPFNDLQWFHSNGTINNWDAYPEYLLGQFKGTDDLATEKSHVSYWLTEAFKNLIDATDCDGFRVDAIKHVEESWIKQWADDMRKHAAWRGKQDFILFGEYFTYNNDVLARYCKDPGYSFNSALFFPMSQTIKSVFVDGQWTGQLSQALAAKNQYGEGADRLVTFIDNHDVNRIGLSISPSGDTGRINWVMRPALTFLYTAAPVPCLYYGTEHAFNQGGHFNGSSTSFDNPDDGDWQRENMSNRGFQPGPANGDKLLETSAPLYQHIRALNEARRNFPALTRGSFSERWQSGSAGAYAYSRTLLNQEALVAVNTSDFQTGTIQPQVDKPNGTEFINVLNPDESLRVENGRLLFSLGGRESKIFVAGSLAKASELRVSSNATELLITYLPNDGPLKNGTSPIEIGLSIDQGEEQFFTMSEAADGTWTFRRSFADITSLLELAFRDSSPVPLVDRSGGDAWILDATQFGQSAVQWLGNTMSFPAEGAITSANDLWIDVEAYPRGTAVGGKVVFTIDDGASWQETPLNLARVVGNNDLLNANLGKFPGGTTLQFAIQVVDANGLERWDNNSGNNYTRTIQFGTTAIGWSGRVNHWPLDGAIEPTDDLWINIESWPQGACIGGEVHYSLDEGVSWEIKPLAFRNAQNNNDFWNCNLGKFAAGTTIQFAVKLTDTTGAVYWHGQQTPFTATVNGVASSLTQIDAPQALGWLEPVAPMATLRFGGDGALMMDVEQQNTALSYQIERTDDLGDWEKFPAIPVSDPGASIWQVMEAGQTSGIGRMFFRVRATGGTTQQITAGQAARVSVRTNPGGATAANLVFTADGGQSWQQLQMLASPGHEAMDEWSAVMPSLSGPAELRYAIELIDQQGRSQWMNNGGNDYRESVITP